MVSGNSNFKHMFSLYLTNTDSCVQFLKCSTPLCKETGFTGDYGWLDLIYFAIYNKKGETSFR